MTPYEAVEPLLPHLLPATRFCEPCAGNGVLIEHLCKNGHVCTASYDIEPQVPWITKANALDLKPADLFGASVIVTNPPWERTMLHPMIEKFRRLADTWLLFDADYMHTIQAAPFLAYCRTIVSVGRVSWMGNGTGGMENAAWYCFQADECKTQFIGREAKTERCDNTMEMF